LISQQRFEEADKILRKAAESNGKELPKKWWLELDDIPLIEDSLGEKVSKKRRYNFLDLFRTSKMRQISLAILFCWPIVSMVYYGMVIKKQFILH
jgi:OCT family organic cation transporter-like MFS transporter 4/5